MHGATKVRLIIGRRATTSRSTHAWVEWETERGTYVLDPTLNWMAFRSSDLRLAPTFPILLTPALVNTAPHRQPLLRRTDADPPRFCDESARSHSEIDRGVRKRLCPSARRATDLQWNRRWPLATSPACASFTAEKNLTGTQYILLPSRERFSILIFVAMEIMKPITTRISHKVCSSFAPPWRLRHWRLLPMWFCRKRRLSPLSRRPPIRKIWLAIISARRSKPSPDRVRGRSWRLSSNGEDQNASEAALLCDDPTIGYQLPAGQSSILVSLANIENIQKDFAPERWCGRAA